MGRERGLTRGRVTGDRAAHAPLVQFLLFAVVGCAAAVGHYGVLIVLSVLAAAPPVLASAAGFLVGGVIGYLPAFGHVFPRQPRCLPTPPRIWASP
ncbi:hypothetical protein GAY28_07585, partial [Azospirillum brasilense]|nr:hypothetical protein [Azospirillum brasilense]